MTTKHHVPKHHIHHTSKKHMTTPATLISVINRSKRVGDDDVERATIAVGRQLGEHVAPLHGLVPAIEFVRSGGSPSPGGAPCYVLDKPDAEGVLGYHYESNDGIAMIKIFMDPILDAGGGSILTGGVSLSAVLSHEAIELAGDGPANKWVDGPDGVDYAYELCMAADTLVRVRDGSLVPMHILAQRGGPLDVIASDPATGRSNVCNATRAFRTRRDAPTVVVRLTNGESFRCTPEHRIMLLDGSFLPAASLRPGTQLRGYVPPGLAVADSIDGREVHTEALSQNRRALRGPPDLHDVRLGEHGSSASLAAQVSVARHPVLRSSIEHVLSMGSNEEVARSHAGAAEASGPAISSASLDRTLLAHTRVVLSVQTADKTDVFDLTVPDLHNFAIGSDVFVHNCDACQSESYDLGGATVADFLLQAFFDPKAEKGSRLDYLGKLEQPFSMSRGGYQITRTEPGKVANVFGERMRSLVVGGLSVHFGPDVPEWRRAGHVWKAKNKRMRRA